MKNSKVVAALFSLVLSFTLNATAAKTAAPADENPVADMASLNAPAYTPVFTDKEMRDWAKKRRDVANVMKFSERDMAQDLKEFRSKLIGDGKTKGVESADQLESLITEVEAKLDDPKTSPAMKYFGAQFILMKPMRGVVWKLRPIFESGSGLLGNRAAHSQMVSIVRFVGQAQAMYLPSMQWKAVFDYLTQPSSQMTAADQFRYVSDFQNSIVMKMVPHFQKQIERITKVRNQQPGALVWDNRMNFGPGTFDDGIRRFAGYDLPEMSMTLGALNMAAAHMLGFASYNQNVISDVIQKMGKMVGVDGYLSSDLGVTSRERVKALKSFEGQNYLRIRTDKNGDKFGRQYMSAAYTYLEHAVAAFSEAHQFLQNGNQQDTILNPVFFSDSNSPELKRGIENMKRLVRGESVRSPITGVTVTVDIPKFYRDPPDSLLALLPTNHRAGGAESAIKGKDGKALIYRNYSVGQPIAWGPEWNKYIPDAQKNGEGYIGEVARHLRMTPGAMQVFGPMAMAVQ